MLPGDDALHVELCAPRAPQTAHRGLDVRDPIAIGLHAIVHLAARPAEHPIAAQRLPIGAAAERTERQPDEGDGERELAAARNHAPLRIAMLRSTSKTSTTPSREIATSCTASSPSGAHRRTVPGR